MKQDHIVEPNKKVTAVDWLKSQIELSVGGYFGSPWAEIFEKAKAMEKEQIAKAWNDGDYAYFYSKETGKEFDNGEEYYNETYK
jgi:hypothetical protein